MPDWLVLDWRGMFVPSQPILEAVIRGSFTYLSLFLMLRLFRRQAGSVGPADLLVLIVIADAAQNAMASEYKAITDGLILVGTIVFWEYALDAASYHVPWIGRLVDPDPQILIDRGRLIEKALRDNLLTRDELMSQLRQKGVDDPARVRCCRIEGDGHISVIVDELTAPPAPSSERPDPR